ncbi:MAG: PIN domain-containing protein [Thermomicrobiales bacterium]|nr:PIN domain-containing protein [Thermomicrobiales bacterium]
MTKLELIRDRAIHEDASISLDSSALIAYLAGEEPHSGVVTELLKSGAQFVVSAITVSESLVRTVETYGGDFAEDILASLLESGRIRLVPFERRHVLEAAAIRSETRLKFPDAAIIATARVAGAIAIVGNDRAWQPKTLGIRYIHLDDVVREQEREIQKETS